MTLFFSSIECKGSCETMVQLLKQLAAVKVIGSDTAGQIHFGNSGTMVLPNSKIVVQVGTRGYTLTQDAPEGKGYSPDYYVFGSDSLAAALAWMKH